MRAGDPRGIGSRVCGEARLERGVKMTRKGGKVVEHVGFCGRAEAVTWSKILRSEAGRVGLQTGCSDSMCGPYSHRFGYYERNDNEMLSLISQKVMAPLPSANKKKQYEIREVLARLKKSRGTCEGSIG